jgi:hypothetical protein
VAALARRSWAALFAALLRAKPGPERSGGTRPSPPWPFPHPPNNRRLTEMPAGVYVWLRM